jgi:hypothetical protein
MTFKSSDRQVIEYTGIYMIYYHDIIIVEIIADSLITEGGTGDPFTMSE